MLADEMGYGLYNSELGYLEQIEVYKLFQSGFVILDVHIFQSSVVMRQSVGNMMHAFLHLFRAFPTV